MHTSCSLSLSLLFSLLQRSLHPQTHTHTRMQTGVTKPWRDRVRFIAHLGWFDQWQSASCKSLPQTELNKQAGSVYTDPDNLLIHITCFLTNTLTHIHTHTHTHTDALSSEYVRRYCVHIQEHKQTAMHESRKHTSAYICMHTHTHIHTLSFLTSSTGHGW